MLARYHKGVLCVVCSINNEFNIKLIYQLTWCETALKPSSQIVTSDVHNINPSVAMLPYDIVIAFQYISKWS